MIPADVPSPIDLRDMADALEWERTAMLRPFREEFFEAIYGQLCLQPNPGLEVIELGSGPGFLAHYILSRAPEVNYRLFDFSPPMHVLAKKRLQGLTSNKVKFIENSFKETDWSENIGRYDAIVTIQAVHELRHKRYAIGLFQQLRSLLKPNGILLFCDHYFGEGGMSNDQLYMSLDEQRGALKSAGFTASEVLVKGGRAFYRAQLEQKAVA